MSVKYQVSATLFIVLFVDYQAEKNNVDLSSIGCHWIGEMSV